MDIVVAIKALTAERRAAEEANVTSFKVELHCSKSKQTQHKKIHFPEESPPTTVAQIRKKVEEDFNIPVCVQSLTYEGYPLSDDTNLELYRIRSGDTFSITYLAEGDCKDIDTIVKWFKQVKMYLESEDPTLSNMRLSHDFDDILTIGINERVIENLAFELLFPWLDPNKYVNKLYFVDIGGLDTIMDVYVAILRHPWTDCLLKLKYIEQGILRILWNLSETFDLRRQIIARNNGLDLCMRSLMREKVVEGEEIRERTEAVTHRNNQWVLVENIGAALGLLCK